MGTGLFLASALPSFKDVINLVDTSADTSEFLSDLTELSAISFLENGNGFSAAVAFLHSVTGPSCVRFLLPYLHEEVIRASSATAGRQSPDCTRHLDPHPDT
jgi:hypothetical protein